MDNKDKNIFSLSLDIDFSSEQKISDLISKYNVRVLYLHNTTYNIWTVNLILFYHIYVQYTIYNYVKYF